MPDQPILPEWREALRQTVWVGLGGLSGAIARYWLGRWVDARWGAHFPWGTLAINLTGSFALGLLMGALLQRVPAGGSPLPRLVLGVGFLGAYTTFSTFSFETLTLLDSGPWHRAGAYVLGSLVGGLLAAWVGYRLGRMT